MMRIAMTAEDPFVQPDPAEDLILTWYYWARSHREFLGYPKGSPMFRMVKSGLTHDPHTDADERDLRIARRQAEAVDVCIDSLPTWQMRSAVDIHAANRACSNSVYSNRRLSPEELHEAYQEAKELLIPMFVRRGLMGEPLPHFATSGTIATESP